MTGSLGWLGHRDLCSIQWSDYCDCGDDDIEIADETDAIEGGES